MRTARAQVALESVLLKSFEHPSQVLERRVIQSRDFQESVLKIWARHVVNAKRAFTDTTLAELLKIKVCQSLNPIKSL